MGIWGKFFGKGGSEQKNLQKPEKPGSAEDAWPEGKDQEVPISNLIFLEVRFGPRKDGDRLDETDEGLLRGNALQLGKAIWPAYFNAVIESKSDVGFGTGFASSFKGNMENASKKASELNAHLVLQTLYPRLRHPTKGECDYQATLIIYLRAAPFQQKAVMLIAPNHHIVPKKMWGGYCPPFL